MRAATSRTDRDRDRRGSGRPRPRCTRRRRCWVSERRPMSRLDAPSDSFLMGCPSNRHASVSVAAPTVRPWLGDNFTIHHACRSICLASAELRQHPRCCGSCTSSVPLSIQTASSYSDSARIRTFPFRTSPARDVLMVRVSVKPGTHRHFEHPC